RDRLVQATCRRSQAFCPASGPNRPGAGFFLPLLAKPRPHTDLEWVSLLTRARLFSGSLRRINPSASDPRFHGLNWPVKQRRASMSALALNHDAWVVVLDGRKALFLRNEGDEKF